MNILKEVKRLQKTDIKNKVNLRLKEFSSFKNKSNKEWFSELCFCILTANSKAKTAIAIQKELGHSGFMHKNLKEVTNCILRNKHRFHNNKAKFIVLARKYSNIKDIITKLNENKAREWLVKNIKGLGYKESSHFLRNVGYFNFAILDRHILSLMNEKKGLTKNNYLRIEKKFKKLSGKLKMSCAELDLYMWYIKTGEILK
jgi:N-glycosylase/DNA lyase